MMNRVGAVLALMVTLGWASISSAAFIVESRSGGQNFTSYSESGTFANSTAKSTAPGVTAGIGSRFGSTNVPVAGAKTATFAHTPTEAGLYETFATWPASTNSSTAVPHIISHTDALGASLTTTVLMNQNTGAGQNPGSSAVWNSLGKYNLNASANTIKETNVGIVHNATFPNFRPDAVMWGNIIVGRAVNTGPADGATDEGTVNGGFVDVLLSWTAGTNATLFDVYLGTTSNSLSLVSAAQAGTTFAATGLSGETQYFWRIDSKAGSDTALGLELDFTTVAVPEPASLGLLATGVVALAQRRRRRA